MSKKQLAEKKKHKREAEKRQKALKRQAESIEDRREKTLAFKEEKDRMGKMPPIRKQTGPSEATVDDVLDKLTHNIEILRSLEEEYDVFQEEKAQRNKELEAQGFNDLESKLNHLHQQVVTGQAASGLSFGGEADVVFTPNTEAVLEDGETILVGGSLGEVQGNDNLA
jgi:hypothetical protein